jgi:hypothetical protein
MIFKPATWYRIALALTALNLVALGFAIRPEEPWWHGASHAALALAFGWWARRLSQRSGGSEARGSAPGERELGGGDGELQARLDELEAEANRVRQELSETQERLDFAERMLAQRPDPRRGGLQP